MERVRVVAALIEREEKFLLGKRSPHKRSAPGYWTAICGKLEPGESEQDGVVREVLEEIGIRVRPTLLVANTLTTDGSAEIHWWRAEVISGEPKLKNSEHTELKWFALAELKRLSPILEEDLKVFLSLG